MMNSVINNWIGLFGARPGDLMLILVRRKVPTQEALSELRLEMARQLDG
jgi:hypothetical protein